MIDMNMDIESIMQECDYIAEVKGEAEAGYAAGRNYGRETHRHNTTGKVFSKYEKQYRSGTNPFNDKTYAPMKTANDYKERADRAASKRRADEGSRNWEKKIGVNRTDNRSSRKHGATYESVSIFDPLFDQI